MDIDPKDIVETAQQAADRKSARLNAVTAVSVAILATFMGICKVKDDNIVQAMQQAQADKLDHWAYYQARNIRQEVADATVVQLELAALSQTPATAPQYRAAIEKYRAIAVDQKTKKERLSAQAAQDQSNYDALNFRDDQLDLSDALLAIAIALLAVTALTQLWALYAVALVTSIFGMLMGLAGLASWKIHPAVLVGWLS